MAEIIIIENTIKEIKETHNKVVEKHNAWPGIIVKRKNTKNILMRDLKKLEFKEEFDFRPDLQNYFKKHRQLKQEQTKQNTSGTSP